MDSQHKHVMFFNVVHLCGKKGKSFFREKGGLANKSIFLSK